MKRDSHSPSLPPSPPPAPLRNAPLSRAPAADERLAEGGAHAAATEFYAMFLKHRARLLQIYDMIALGAAVSTGPIGRTAPPQFPPRISAGHSGRL